MAPDTYVDRNAYILFCVSARRVDQKTEQCLQDLKTLYAAYARQHSWKVETLHLDASWKAGMIKAALRVVGWGAYGMLSGEEGVLRPQSSQSDKKRDVTTLVEVDIVPEADEQEWAPLQKEVHEEVFYSFVQSLVPEAFRLNYAPQNLTVDCRVDSPIFNHSLGRYLLQRNQGAAWSLLLHHLRGLEPLVGGATVHIVPAIVCALLVLPAVHTAHF